VTILGVMPGATAIETKVIVHSSLSFPIGNLAVLSKLGGQVGGRRRLSGFLFQVRVGRR
jgi:hypothetical protein